MFPLWNSPQRKEYYREVLKDHQDVLLTQIQNKYEDRKQQKINRLIKGDPYISIAESYNPDFDRMQKQFRKYFANENNIQKNIHVEDFIGDPMKRRDYDMAVSYLKLLKIMYRMIDLFYRRKETRNNCRIIK